MGFFDRLRQVLEDYDKSSKPIQDSVPVEENPQSSLPPRSDTDIFNKSLEFVLAMEGGYVNDPHDPGGATKYGISHRAYPHLNIEALTLDDARTIYLRDYWLGSGAKVAAISPELAMIMFDTAVNMGVSTSIRLLQRVLHIKEDGVFGPITKNTLETADIPSTIDWYMTNRILRYADLEGWSRYRRGWIKRATSLLRQAFGGK